MAAETWRQKARKLAAASYARAVEQYPLSYYALMSFNRLREGHARAFRTAKRRWLRSVGAGRWRWNFDIRKLRKEPAFRRGVELARLGLGERHAECQAHDQSR